MRNKTKIWTIIHKNYLTYLLVMLILFASAHSSLSANNDPNAECELESSTETYECEVSISLYDDINCGSRCTQLGPSAGWFPTADEQEYLEGQFRDFVDHICKATHGYVQMEEIYVDARKKISGKSKSHIHFFKSAALYRNDEDSIRAYTDPALPFPKSGGIVLITNDPSLKRDYRAEGSNAPTIEHDYIGKVIAHEIGHSLLGLADEYKGNVSSSPQCQPRSSDMALETLMSDHTLFPDRFSKPSDYEPAVTPLNYRTAQERCYHGDSAWETLLRPAACYYPRSAVQIRSIFRNRLNLVHLNKGSIFPRNCIKQIEVPPVVGCSSSDTYIEWITEDPVSNIVMLIDTSSSMRGDPLNMAKEVADELIDFLTVKDAGTGNIKFSIIAFNDDLITEIGLTGLEGLGAIKSEINGLTAGGDKNFEAALKEALSIIRKNELITEDESYEVWMISDGGAGAVPSNLDSFDEDDIPIHTIGIRNRNVDKRVLEEIADQTEGKYSSDSENFHEILRNTSVVNTNQVGGLNAYTKAALSPPTMGTSMIGEAISADFILRWDDSATLKDFTLKQPDGIVIQSDGIVINEDYAESTVTVTHFLGDTQAIYSIDFPLSGQWEFLIDGTGDFNYELALESVITADFIAASTSVMYPEPIPLQVGVGGDRPIVNADVIAEITLPSSDTVTIQLADNGNSPDGIAGDGIYTGVLDDYSQDGIYKIKVTINNLDGNAQLDDSKVAFSIGTTPSTPTSAPLFQRFINTQIEVTGTEAQSSTETIVITPDNTLYWGRISQSGQVDRYRFSAVQGTTYYIRTSQLLGADMITDVKLYELEGSTPIESSTGNQDMPTSDIEWLAPMSDDYLISVERANEGTGTYAIRVGDYDFHGRIAAASASSGGASNGGGTSSGGGGGADYILLLLLLILVLRCHNIFNRHISIRLDELRRHRRI